MKYYRYGTFHFMNYWPSWMSIVILLFFAIASLILKLPLLFSVFPIVYAMVWIWTILAPQFERFVINDDHILSCSFGKERVIMLPSELTIVISLADICPLFAVRTAIGNQTHILKGRYAVSILHKLPQNEVLEKLHLPYFKLYTTSTIQRSFSSPQYIYSFVCDEHLLSELITNRRCHFIIPESLLNQISIDSRQINVHIDTGY